MGAWGVLAGLCLFCYLIWSSLCRWLCSRRFLSVFSRLCSRTFSSSRCLSALRDVISLCCRSRCLSASSCIRASRLRVWCSSSSRWEVEVAASGADFSFFSCWWITDFNRQIWEHRNLFIMRNRKNFVSINELWILYIVPSHHCWHLSVSFQVPPFPSPARCVAPLLLSSPPPDVHTPFKNVHNQQNNCYINISSFLGINPTTLSSSYY